jgi:hypothetical protein
MKHAYYVKGDNGQFYALVKTEQAQHGFYLCTDNRTYDGGFGSGAQTWERVKATQVPQSFKQAIGGLTNLKAEIEA